MIMSNLKLDIKNNNIYLLDFEKEISFRYSYKLIFRQVLIKDNILYILARPSTTEDSRSPDFVPYDKNNVFAFDLEGNLLWRAGKYIQTLGDGREVELPASSLATDNEMIKLYYQSDHEVWLDPKTGEKIKEEFVFKK